MKKTVIITGGTKGIGAGIARGFHAAGWSVMTVSRKDSGLAGELGEQARFVAVDVVREQDHRNAVRAMLEWRGQLDAYVNCAGFSEWKALNEVDENFWNRMIDTNLKGTIWGCKAAAEALGDGGAIINISSLAGKRGSANNAVYCASKFGVNGITQALAKELGPRGIRVNALCPVYVETPGLLEALADPRSPTAGNDIRAYFDSFRQSQSALNRLPTAQEVAEFCIFLATPKASAITGQCINIDCGVLPQ